MKKYLYIPKKLIIINKHLDDIKINKSIWSIIKEKLSIKN